MINSSNKNIISLPTNITRTGMDSLLIYFGYGKLNINDENVCDIMVASIEFEISELLELCQKYKYNYFKIYFK